MTSQLFKKKYPKDKIFSFLDKYCDKTDKYYRVSKVSYKKAKIEGAIVKLFEDLKEYYHKSKHFYLDRGDNYKNLITVLRQICKNHNSGYI